MSQGATRKILENHRLGLARTLESLVSDRETIEIQKPGGSFEHFCCDNRHLPDYYKKYEAYINELWKKPKRSISDYEKIIDHALTSKYHNFSYHDMNDERLHRLEKAKIPGGWAQLAHFKLMNQALVELKLKNSPAQGQLYLTQALNALQNDPPINAMEHMITKTWLYDYSAMCAEAQSAWKNANTFLSQAITAAETCRENQWLRNLKYLYIRRAAVHRQQNNPRAALRDLGQALTYRQEQAFGLGNICTKDEIIFWEKVKIYVAEKDYPAARKNLTILINLTKINLNCWTPNIRPPPHQPVLLTLKELAIRLRPAKATPISRLKASERTALPEPSRNYDSFQVNVKCPGYQAFIAKINSKKRKTLRDWEYLVAYCFGLTSENSEYEKDIPPRPTLARGHETHWWVPGVHALYLDRDYEAAIQLFADQVAQKPTPMGYELLAKAQIAAGDYKGALPILTRGISEMESALGACPDNVQSIVQLKNYLLMRGSVYAKMKKIAAARRDYTYRLESKKSYNLGKLQDRILWERARLSLAEGDPAAARKDLKQIHDNSACAALLKSLRQK